MRVLSLTKPRPLAVWMSLVVLALLATAGTGWAEHSTTPFKGVKVNGGTVMHESKDGRIVLTLSSDFKVPEAPDPHWQVVDSKGNVYLLQKLTVKPDKLNRSITLPAYVHDVVKVQMWCAFAEVLLGEASFESPVM